MEIYEPEAFKSKADRLMTGFERRQLHLALADDQMCGEQSSEHPGLWTVELFDKFRVVYTIESPDVVNLLDVELVSAPAVAASPAEKTRLQVAVQAATRFGIAMGVKEGLQFLWHLFKG